MALLNDSVRDLLQLAIGPVQAAPRDNNGVLAFKGIPYATPPVGELLWRAQHPAAAWSTVLDASHFGPHGISSTSPKGNESEDSLTINVWTGAASAEERRPVMIWIPGGGFQVAQWSRVNIDGASLAKNGVVLVSFNYRANIFGFPAHPGLEAEGSPSGNFGLQDQIAALQWVRENIETLGGDAENVTIFGESAGATSVTLLMASPRAGCLFHRAIGESDGFCESIHGSMQTADEASRKGESFVARVAGGSLAALRLLPADEIRQAVAIHAFDAAVDALAGAARNQDFRAHYPFLETQGIEGALVRLSGDTFVVEQASRWLRVHNSIASVPVFGYLFDVNTAYTPVSAHTAEIDYVFFSRACKDRTAAGRNPGELM